MTKKPITRREMLAYANFVAPAFGKDAPDVPKARAKSRDLEHKEQVKVIVWWSKNHHVFNLPIFALFSIPNGGARGIETAQRMKDEGVRSGIPDLFLAVSPCEGHDIAWQGMFIEMKSQEGSESEQQKIVRNFLSNEYYCVVAKGAEEAISFIKSYLGK